MYKMYLAFLLITFQFCFNFAFNIESVEFDLMENKFRVSIPNDPGIKWVAFIININKEFNSFEAGQLSGVSSLPKHGKWSYEFQRSLADNDVVYLWLAVHHNKVTFRVKREPISVKSIRNGEPDYSVRNRVRTPPTTTTKPIPPKPVSSNSNPVNEICYASLTEVQNSIKNHCIGDMLFEETFETLSSQRWTNEVRIASDKHNPDAEFVLYNGTAYVENSMLKIPASLYRGNIYRDSIDVSDRCTGIGKECSLEADGIYYLPPIVSGRINTKKSFNFKYGRIEVRAKLPIGDWLVPLILLEPSTISYGTKRYDNGEMRIAFARGNQEFTTESVNIDGRRLYGGPIVSAKAELRQQFMANVTLDEDNGVSEHFGKQFHVYSLTWKPNEFLLTVDNNDYGRVPANFKDAGQKNSAWRSEGAPFDQMFYLTLGLSAGGHGDFPNAPNKPWNNSDPRAVVRFNDEKQVWSKTWSSNSSLEVDYIRVFAI